MFKCDICDRELTSKYYVNKHKELIHKIYRRRQCKHCNKLIPRNDYHDHTQKCYVTKFIDSIRCRNCNKVFANKHLLFNHIEEELTRLHNRNNDELIIYDASGNFILDLNVPLQF